jgi:hypothetical protein
MHADCSRCAALCCVGSLFRASSEFAADKAAGVRCPHLVGERTCGLHDRLRSSGYRGCAAFDCFGAGQHVIQVTFAGSRLQGDSAEAATVFAVFEVMRRLKELLWHLADAASAIVEGPLSDEVRQLRVMLEELKARDASELEHLDVFRLRDQVMEPSGEPARHGGCKWPTRRVSSWQPRTCREPTWLTRTCEAPTSVTHGCPTPCSRTPSSCRRSLWGRHERHRHPRRSPGREPVPHADAARGNDRRRDDDNSPGVAPTGTLEHWRRGVKPRSVQARCPSAVGNLRDTFFRGVEDAAIKPGLGDSTS